MNLRERVLMLMIILSAMFSLFFLFFKKGQHMLLVYLGILVELLSVLLLSLLSQKDNIKNSSDNIKKLDEKYKQIRTWLEDIGYCEENQIKLLCIRCKKIIEINDTTNEKRKKLIEKILGITLVPLFAAFISNIFGIANNLNENVETMKNLAIQGHGLNSFININVKYLYER